MVEWNEFRCKQLSHSYSTLWGKENEMAKIEESILAISVFLPRFNATSRHYYYRIRIFLRHLSLEIQSLLFIFVDFLKRKPPRN